jgi:tetratricopeptide (TPR) repeat protein
MNVSGTHGFTFLDTWPVDMAGVDVSFIGDYTDQVALFAYGSNEPFFAAYHPATRTGTAHFADPVAVPGKKLFAWGPGPNGDGYVMSRLTQNFPSYIESQGGVTPNQETRLWLEPQQASQFTEYWMPVRELAGVSRANLAGVLYLGRTTGTPPTLVAEFNANQPMAGETVNILNGGTTIFTETVDLDPATTFACSIANPLPSVNYTFEIVDPVQGVVFTHTENTLNALGPTDVTLGAQPAPNFNQFGTDQEVLADALNFEQFMEYGSAESTYSAGLVLFPQSAILLKAAGRLAVSASRFTDAISQLTQVPGDDEAQYYLGLAYAGLGQYNQAAATWSSLQLSPTFGAAAAFQLASITALAGNLPAAASLFDSLNTLRAGALEVAILRNQGQTLAASTKLAQWQAVSPTDLFLRNEAVLLGGTDAALPSDLSAQPERILNLVDDYFRLGFWADAVGLLSITYPDVPGPQRELGTVTPQNNGLIAYYRGYANQQLGVSPASDFNAASGMSLQYLFPNRFTSFAVLGAATQFNPSDSSAHFLLGNLYMSRRQVANAITEWQTTRSLNKAILTLHRNLGRAYLDILNDANTALPILQEGLTYDPTNPDLQKAYHRALIAVSPPTVSGPPITIFGTGVSAPMIPLPPGTADPNYTIISSGDTSYPGPTAYVVNSGFPIPPWINNSTYSQWIAPRADAGNGNAPGSYTYRTTFNLARFDPTSAVLSGRVAADNSVAITLNGVTGSSLPVSYDGWNYFTLNSGFVSGMNTLDFVVTTAPPGVSPTGLRVDVSGAANLIAAAPTFNPPAGTYNAPQTITLSTATAGASINFTTDGSTPTSSTGSLYSGPIALGTTTVINAIAFAGGITSSAVTSGTYTINLPVTTITSNPPGLSLTVDGVICTAPCPFQWIAGSSHTLAAASPQAGNSGTQYLYASWSDTGAQSHNVTAPTNSSIYTAAFTTQYLLTTTASPSGSGTIVPASGWFNSGTTIAVSATANNGYLFSNFSEALSGTTSPQNVTLGAPASVTATFSLPVTTIGSNPAGLSLTVDGASCTAPCTFRWVAGSSHTLAAASPQAGTSGTQYVYASWSDSGAQSHIIVAPTNSATYTAAFTTQYLLTTTASPSGTGFVLPATAWVNSGTTVAVSAKADNGYLFSGFSGVLSGTTSPQNLTVTNAASVTATFSLPVTTITSNPPGLSLTVDGASCTAPCPFQWTAGSSHTIAVASLQAGTTGTQYVFASWSDKKARTHAIKASTSSATYTAAFTTQYRLATTASPSGSGTVLPASDWFDCGAVVTVTATAHKKYQFSGFSGALSGTNSPQKFTITTPGSITATFKIQ